MCLAGLGAGVTTVNQKRQSDLEGAHCVCCVPSAHPEASSPCGGTPHGGVRDTGNGLF